MGCGDELNLRQCAGKPREQLRLPPRMEVQVDLVDHDDALILVEPLPAGACLTDVIQQIADPPQECPVSVREGGERNTRTTVLKDILAVFHIARESIPPGSEKAIDERSDLGEAPRISGLVTRQPMTQGEEGIGFLEETHDPPCARER